MTHQDSPRNKKVALIQRYQWLSTHCLPESHCTPPILWEMSHSHLPWKPGSSTAPLCSHHIRQLAAHHNTQHTKKIISCKSFSTGLDSVSLSLSLSFLGYFFVFISCRMRSMTMLVRKAEAEMVIREGGEENRQLNLPYQGWREERKRYSLPSCVSACMDLETDKGFSQAHHWYHPLGAPSAVGWYESPNPSPSPSPPHSSWKSPACCSPLGPQMNSFSRSRRSRRRRRSRSSPAQREAHQLKRKKNLTSSRGKIPSASEENFSSNLRENPAHFETGTVTLELGPVLNVHPQVGESFNCAIIPKKDRRDVCNGRSTDGHCLVLGFWSRVVVLRARIQESVFIRQFRHPGHSPTLTFSLVKNSKEYQLRPPVKSPRQLDQWFSLANQSRREIFILFFGSLTRSFSLQWWVTLTLNP